MKFNSQICTTREQSERLLALGLKKETADMHWYKPAEFEHDYWYEGIGESWATSDIPAWSLHRLCMLVRPMLENETQLTIPLEGTYDEIIDAFEIAIKEGYFNKEYLDI